MVLRQLCASPHHFPLRPTSSHFKSLAFDHLTSFCPFQAFLGLTGAVFGSLAFGTAGLPFIVASTLGFALSSFRWYYNSVGNALLSLDAHPAILRLHLDANYPHKRFGRWGLDRMRSGVFKQSWILKNMLVVAWLTAQPALDVSPSLPADSEIEFLVGKYAG